MNHINKRAAALFTVILLLLFGAGSIGASAEGGAAITAPASAEPGSTVEVILTFSADSRIGSVEANLAYDESRLVYTEGSATGGCGVLHLHNFPDTETDTFSLTLKFLAGSPGKADIQLKNCVISSPDGVPLASPEASASVEIKDSSSGSSEADSSAPDSSEAAGDSSSQDESVSPDPDSGRLKQLVVSESLLQPEFSPDIYDYTVRIPSDRETLSIYAERADTDDEIWFKCSTWFDGEVTLTNANVHIVEDETRVFITVKDVDENEKLYKLMIYRDNNNSKPDDGSSAAEPETAVTASQETVTSPADEVSSAADSSSADSGKSGVSELRDKLMPALLIILAALVAALIILIVWMRNRSASRRHRIKSSRGKK